MDLLLPCGGKEMNKKIEYLGLDYFKIIAAFLIVAVHTSPLSTYNQTADFILTRIIARVGVPFFFMITGYFIIAPYIKSQKANKQDLKIFMFKMCKLYGVAILIYIPLNIYMGYFNSKELILKILKDLFFNGTLYHLWYLPAAILGIGIVYFLILKLRAPFLYVIVFILYLIGLLGDSYYGIVAQVPIITSGYDMIFQVFDYTRNGLFFAPIFIVLGASINNNESNSKGSRDIIGLSISLTLLLIEGLMLRRFQMQRHDSMYLFLVPSMYFLFRMLMQLKGSSKKNLRSISMLIYILHPMVIVMVRGIAKIFNMQLIFIDNSFIHYILVCTISLFVANITLSMKARLKPKPNEKGRAWVEIDLKNLSRNLKTLKDILPPKCNVMAVVKANAYGHGCIKVSKKLSDLGVNFFAVATITEGVNMRKKGVRGDILVLGYTSPKDFKCLVKYRLSQTIVDYNYARILNEFGKKINVHIKLDTGMHRLGENYDNITNIVEILECKYLKVQGIYTHLCVSDSLKESDMTFSRLQIERFYKTVEEIKKLGYNSFKLHIQSSYGVLNYPLLDCDYARIGIALYGVLSTVGDETTVSVDLKPVLSVRARIVMIKNIGDNETVGYGQQFVAYKPMSIAVVSIGYADGIPRNLTESGSIVLVKSKKAPIIGRICMDQMIIDVTDIPDVLPNDIVTIIGSDGKEQISCEEVAKKSGTITNELLSRLGSRLEHVYLS